MQVNHPIPKIIQQLFSRLSILRLHFHFHVQVNHPVPENVKRHAGSSLEDTLLLLDIVKETNMKQQKQKKVKVYLWNSMEGPAL